MNECRRLLLSFVIISAVITLSLIIPVVVLKVRRGNRMENKKIKKKKIWFKILGILILLFGTIVIIQIYCLSPKNMPIAKLILKLFPGLLYFAVGAITLLWK